MPAVPLDPDPDTFDALTSACVAFVREQLTTLAEQPASDVETRDALVEEFDERAPEEGRPMADILARLRPAVAASFNTAGPGYLAFIPGGGLYAAALADYVALSVNRYVGVEAAAPALAAIERAAIRWLADMMGLGPAARGVLTTGGSMSNLMALVTARTAKLPEDFLRGVIYLSDQAHQSLVKAARLAGFPSRNVRKIPVDARMRMEVSALERAVEEDRARGLEPFLVVASAGTTNTGAIDPLEALADVAARHGLWLHADAAYGGFFNLTRDGAAAMRGIARCDSVTLDPHKTLFLPYGTGCLLVRDGGALRRAHASEADYLRDVSAHRDATHADFTDLSPELSREMRGLRVWLPIMLHGVGAFRAALEEKLALARWAHGELASDARFEVEAAPELSVVAFRLRGDGAEADARNAELLRRVNARGRVFLSSTVLRERLTLRLCIVSFRTHHDRVRDAVVALREEATPLAR